MNIIIQSYLLKIVSHFGRHGLFVSCLYMQGLATINFLDGERGARDTSAG